MHKTIKVIVVAMLTLFLSVVGCQSLPESSDGTASEGNRIGNKAPDFQLDNLEGQSVSLRDFRGSPVLINFWATWCGYCIYEMPFLEEIKEEWADRGLEILAVDSGESRSRVEAFLETNDISLLVLLDTDKSVTRKYLISGFPTTFFIDKDGIIREIIIGAFPSKGAIERVLTRVFP